MSDMLERFIGILPKTASINTAGHLEIGGVDMAEIVNKFGTPLFVYDEESIRTQCRRFTKSFSNHDDRSKIVYASKAFNSIAICQIIDEEGLHIDVSTYGELETALRAGIDGSRIYFHGNNKSNEELEKALDGKVGIIVIDSFDEVKLLSKIAKQKSIRQEVLIRLTPGIKANTHQYLITGDIDCKFGLGIENGAALEAIKEILNDDNLILSGVHIHIGSQIFALHSYAKAIEIAAKFLKYVKKETGWEANELNMGGGLGIKYSQADKPSTVEELAKVISKTIKDEFGKLSLKIPLIAVEPGRSIVANAGITLYRVGVVKDVVRNIKKEKSVIYTYISVDGGMSDNLRPILYGAEYEAIVANKANETPSGIVSIVGKHCEPGDVLIKEANIAECQRDDIIAVFATGAYGFAMASNYNRQTKPGVVLVKNGNISEIIKRETIDDLLKYDVKLFDNKDSKL